jgi:endonuclease/exonuclease/phosphatase family metal-dependent hydrolase
VITTRPVLSYHVIDLGRAPGDAVPRAAQVLTVASPGGGPVRVVNTHLTHRLTSPVQLVLLAGRLAAGSEPTVIAGDLNMPGPATLAASRYRRVLRAPTYPAHCPLIQLDHFLIGPGLHAESAEVLTGVGSDHLPIRAHLRLSDR